MLANSVEPDEMWFDFYFWHAKREKFVEIVRQQSKLSWRGGGFLQNQGRKERIWPLNRQWN